MNKDEVYKICSGLVKSNIITRETAIKIITKTLVLDSNTPSSTEELLLGIRQLLKENLIQLDDSMSYSKALIEQQLKAEYHPLTSSRSARSHNVINRQSGYSQEHRFEKGELTEAVITSITKGNVTSKNIVGDIAQTFGFPVSSNFVSSVYGTLSRLNKLEKICKDEQGNWSVLEYSSSKQAGTNNFTPIEEINKEFQSTK